MSRWLPRSLWLFAWSFWAWLGVGLHRELPRDLGPVVCQLALSEEEEFKGWLPGESLAVTIEEQGDDEPYLVRTYDAQTGKVRTQIDGPIRKPMRWDYDACLTHSVLICRERPDIPGRPAAEQGAALHLKTGQWIDLPFGPDGKDGIAPRSPYALSSQQRKGDSPQLVDGRPHPPILPENDWRVRVIDLRNGRVVLDVTPHIGGQPSRDLAGGSFFLSEDAIVIQTLLDLADEQERSSEDYRAEVWRFNSPNEPFEVIKGLRIEDDPSVSENGRVAWHVVGDVPAHVDVFDFNKKQMVFSAPPKGERKTLPGGTSGYWPGPRISADGRTVFVPMAKTLWDIQRSNALWKASEFNMLAVFDSGREVIIQEEWPNFFWPSMLPKFKTFAIRDMSSLRLTQRTWFPTSVDSSQEFRLDDDHNVHRLTPVVNWPLLALCQTILAMPLILLWAILRWRRKRRMRMARVTP